MEEVWSAANVTSNANLIEVCIPRIAGDFERLASSQPFLQHVGADQLQTLLHSPWICDGKETLKFKAICTWLHASSLNDEHVKIEKHFRPLLKLIDMKKLPTEVIIETSVSGSDYNLSESARRRKLPPMPTPRCATAATHIPGVGDIVVGGCGKINDKYPTYNKAEIFLTTSSPLGLAGSWCEIAPMLHSRSYPAAEFFNGNVYVASGSMEMLSFSTEGPPQWTEVINTTLKLKSLISFNGSLLFGAECVEEQLHALWNNLDGVVSEAVAYEGIRAKMIDCAQIILMPESSFTKNYLLIRQEFTWKKKFFAKASAQLIDVSMSLGCKSSILEIPVHTGRYSFDTNQGTKMTTVLSENTGIQVVDMKDLEEVIFQCGDEVYVAGVTASKPKYIGDSYAPIRDHNVTGPTSNKRREVIVISVPKKLECVQLNQKATNLLKQSSDLREIHSTVSSSVSQPRLRMGSVLGTPIRFDGSLISQQPMTAIINQSPTFNTFSSQDLAAAEASRITSAHTGNGGRQFTFTGLNNSPAISSQYSPSARAFEQLGIRCNCGLHLAAVSAVSSPVEISCSSCARRNFEILRELGKESVFTCDCGREYGGISMLPIKLTCLSWRPVVPVVVDAISIHSRVYESCHITCEAAIKPTMVSKRLTANIQPDGIEAGCEASTYKVV
ncbi:unnamed protein product [Rodentolepis nana]|uniref:BACK domain-containing protein n=1 Tax=Rodentolepis nana TaxID=102285 RepID=A0A3P7RSN4_RODNA|nr:unnamed protein product [Rodentolepis nana]